jgi:HK97 family phage prohead protease
VKRAATAPGLYGGALRFAGYAAIFGRADRGGDVVRKGAFAESLVRADNVPLLWQHKAGSVIGRVEHLAEDDRGLRVVARLGTCFDAHRAARLLQAKKLDGLSFGYRVREARSAGGLRELIELDLVEISLVMHPMQPGARVHAIETSKIEPEEQLAESE